MRGHGESEHRAAQYDQWDLMQDHIALLDSMGIDRAIWGPLYEAMASVLASDGWNDQLVEAAKLSRSSFTVRKSLVDFVKLPKAGHSSTVEKPEAVTEAIERFLART